MTTNTASEAMLPDDIEGALGEFATLCLDQPSEDDYAIGLANLRYAIAQALAPTAAAPGEETFDAWWDKQIELNGGVEIGADYRHWAKAGWVSASPQLAGEEAVADALREAAEGAHAFIGVMFGDMNGRVPARVDTPHGISVKLGEIQSALEAALAAPSLADQTHSAPGGDESIECHGLDTPERVCFYEQDYYVLSNFSAFNLQMYMLTFPTSEHAYHWAKFRTPIGVNTNARAHTVASEILNAPSAHEAFKIAERNKALRRSDWDDVKVDFMRKFLRAKADQHEYVRRKLLATGDRELVENSWRDGYWGWGPNRDGLNMLGKLWMEVRAELRAINAAIAKDSV